MASTGSCCGVDKMGLEPHLTPRYVRRPMPALSRSLLVLVLVAENGCGDDGIHHLPDAPLVEDAPPDTTPAMVPLLVTLAGTGTGTITSSPDGILCGANCNATFPKHTVVTLTAVPGTGSAFAGWSGSCTGAEPTCDVTLETAKAATATFNLKTYTVTVTKAGAGTGTVAGGGIACGTSCTLTVPHGTQMTLTSAPAALSTFAGWGGACSGTGACTLTVTDTTSVSANFVLDDVTLFVTPGGNGTGTVTSNPAGITCGVDCNQTYTANQMVTLTATPGTGSTFSGWSGGGCSGNGTCTVTMTAAVTVTATFTLNLVTLVVTKSGGGAGTVTDTGIACGADCVETVNYGTTFTLAAAPSTADATASRFTGWSGSGCSGTGGCTVTLTADATVDAGFKLNPNIMFVTSTTSNGSLGGLAGADTACKDRAAAAGLPGNYVAYLSTSTITAPSRVGAASGWVRTDRRVVMNSITQMHLGTLVNPPQLAEDMSDVSATFPFAWTGTSVAGTFLSSCGSTPWGGPQGGTNVGRIDQTNSTVVNSMTTTCDVPHRLYCLGIDRTATAP